MGYRKTKSPMLLRSPPAQRRIARTTPARGSRTVLVSRVGRRHQRAFLLAARSHPTRPAMLRTPCLVGRSEATHRVGPDRLSPVAKRCAGRLLSGALRRTAAGAVRARTERSNVQSLSATGDATNSTAMLRFVKHCASMRDATSPSLKSALNLRVWPASLIV